MLLNNNLIGRKLINIIGSVYFENKNIIQEKFESTDIINFCILLEDINITVKRGNEGESLILTQNEHLKDTDMHEQGFIKVVSLSEHLKIKDYIGLELLDLQFITNEQKIVGLLLSFSNEKEVFIINLGDDLYLFKDFPNHLQKDGYDFIKRNINFIESV